MKIKVISGLAALTRAWSLQVGAQAAQTSNRESEPANSAFIDWWNGKCATGNGLGLRLEWKANVLWNIDGGLQQRFGYDDPEPSSVRDFLTLSGGWQNPSDFFIVRSGKFFLNNTFNSGRALAGSESPGRGSYSALAHLKIKPLDWYYGQFVSGDSETSRHGCAARNPDGRQPGHAMPQSKRGENANASRLPRRPICQTA